MRTSEKRLIQQLQERNADRERATDGGIHPRKAISPATTKALQVSERLIGFELPDLLGAIYLEVANGGFGPEYGLVGTKGGASLDGCTLETCYQDMLALDTQNAV